ncbi:hypothetical protein PPL_11555 [Heterostelium album PN500]|uniref:Elongator complex protein 5 n=1 Tax=Heterostelium pallidum (strain ATCC 26659 / Pp 5 / PN500) TaxID=670386 RepID=D3BVG4_HETP5|nr:hypothetical protein PPL_11555 [Heterostelium album PN500]EFA74587.1 hypothetical protein PPL_11555 [Heterostelium album PN500]|eukprot:XP_020426721.1 hypothetical protein PPL_11555 [Heterostelium album PN500]
MFSKILQTTDTLNGLLLLEDSLDSSSQHLLNHLYDYWLRPINSNQSTATSSGLQVPNLKKNVWFINQSQPLSEYIKLSKKYNNINFIVIDCYSDPFGWNISNNNSNSNEGPIVFNCSKQDSQSIIETVKSVFNSNSVSSKLKESPVLVINTISSLVLKNGLSDTCNLIRSLINFSNVNNNNSNSSGSNNSSSNKQSTLSSTMNRIQTGIQGGVQQRATKSERSFTCLLGILHNDLHYSDTSVTKQLEYISSTSIQVTPLPAKILLSESLTNRYEATITVITKKRSGRVVRNNDGRLGFDSSELFEKKEEVKEVDPTKNLSFNLKLSEDEKNARDNVVLPYRHQGENQLIIEDPEEDDDYDDEDPDDDLDI